MTAALLHQLDEAGPPALPRRRPGWLVAGAIVAVLLLGIGAWDLVGAVDRQPLHLRHTWTGPLQRLDLEVGNGSVTVTPAAAGSPATVEADGSRGLSSPSDHESLARGTLRIRSSCPFNFGADWCSLSYRVTLPAGTAVVAHSSDGSVTATGLTGALQLSSGDGSVTVSGARGSLVLHSSDGSVHVTGAASARVQASSGDGSVHLAFSRPPQSVTAHSSDGSVTIQLPPSSDAYHLDAHSSDGHVTAPIRTDPASGRTITATSGDGSVTVAYSSG